MSQRLSISLLVWLLAGFGIFPGVSHGKAVNTPDGVVRAMAKGIQHNQPQLLWEQLPPAYQKNLHDLIHQFAKTIDPDLYQQALRMTQQLVSLLQHKKSFILNSSLLASPQVQANKAELNQHWNTLINLSQTLITSDLARLEALRQLQVVAFLNHTGRQLLQQLNTAPGIIGVVQVLKNATAIRLATQDGDQATVILFNKQGQQTTITMTRNEGYWLPAPGFHDWQPALVRAKQALMHLTPEKMAQYKAQTTQAMGLLEMMLTQLAQTESQAQFDQATMGVMMGLISLSVITTSPPVSR